MAADRAIPDIGKTLYVPKMLDKERGIMDFLQIFGEHDLRTLPAGQWGIREPDEVRDGARRLSGQSRLRSERSPLLTRRSTRAPLLRCNPSLGCTRATHDPQRSARAQSRSS